VLSTISGAAASTSASMASGVVWPLENNDGRMALVAKNPISEVTRWLTFLNECIALLAKIERPRSSL
jgi:hypothetical protein